jgi:two-component system NtrC family sensor kinase
MKIRSLRTKFILLFLVFFFVPFVALTFLSLSMSREMMMKSTVSHLQNLVDVKGMAIEQWLKERVADGRTISESQEIKSLDPMRIEPYLNLVKNFYQAYRDLSVISLKGEKVSRTSSRVSFEKEEWFRKAIEKGDFISKPAVSPQSDSPTVIMSFLIQDAAHPIGVLNETLDLGYVSQLIAEAKLGKTGELYVVDREGKFILHKVLKELSSRKIFKVPYFEDSSKEPTRTAVYRDYKGNEVLGAWKWIPTLQCYLIAEQDAKEAFYQTHRLIKRASIIFAVSALLIFALSYLAIKTVTHPIRVLSEAVTALARGDFSKPLVTHREDEIGRLFTGFNTTAGQLKKAYSELEGKVKASDKELEMAYQILRQRQEQLVRSEKMAALGQLSAGIAHEIRNPLTSIKIFIQSLEKEIDLDENRSEDFRIIKKEIDRINENISRFLNFARPEEPQFQPVNIHALLVDTLNLLAAKIKSSSIRLNTFLQEGLALVEGDPKQLGQVFLNLILNAIEAMPEGGDLTISLTGEVDPDSREDALQVVFQDSGCGISENDRPYLFDPFFTTKEKGTGLGLSIVYSIVQKHNGQIEVKSEPGKGSSFVVSLPIRKEEAWKESSSSMMT